MSNFNFDAKVFANDHFDRRNAAEFDYRVGHRIAAASASRGAARHSTIFHGILTPMDSHAIGSERCSLKFLANGSDNALDE